MSDAGSDEDLTTLTFQRGSSAPTTAVAVPEGWTASELITELLRVAQALTAHLGTEADTDEPSYLARMLKSNAESFHGATVQQTRASLLSGPGRVGMLLNGDVADTNRRFCFEPVRVLITTVLCLCTFHEADKSDRERLQDLWYAVMLLKGWMVSAVTDGSGVFSSRADNPALLAELSEQACRALTWGDVLLQEQPPVDWSGGIYDKLIAGYPIKKLVTEFLGKVADAVAARSTS